MKLPLGFMVALILLGLPIYILVTDNSEAQEQAWRSWIQELRSEAHGRLEKIQDRASTSDFLLTKIRIFLKKGQELALASPGKTLPLLLDDLHKRIIGGSFPRHDLGFGFLDPTKSRWKEVFHYSDGVGLDRKLSEGAMMINLRGFYPRGFFEKEAAALSGPFGFPFNINAVDYNFEDDIHVFTSVEGIKGFFLGTHPETFQDASSRAILVVLMDLDGIDSGFGPRKYIREWEEDGSALVFASRDLGEPLRTDNLPAESPLWKALNAKIRAEQDEEMTDSILEGHLVCSSPPSEEFPFRAIITIPLGEDFQPRGLGKWTMAGIGGILGLGFLFILPKALLGKGLRFPVGLALFAAFLAAGLLPSIKLFGLFHLSQIRQEERINDAEERRLHSEVMSVDQKVQILRATHFQTLRQGAREPIFSRLLDSEERGESAGNEALNWFAGRQSPNLPILPDFSLTGLIVSGERDFKRVWEKNTLYGEESDRKLTWMNRLFVPMIQKCWDCNFPSSRKDFETTRKSDLARVNPTQLTMEGVWEFFARIGSGENFLDFLYFPERTQVLKTSFGAMTLATFPVRENGKVRFILAVFWDDNSLPGILLKHVLSSDLQSEGKSSLHMIESPGDADPEIFPLSSYSQILFDLSRRARKNGVPAKTKVDETWGSGDSPDPAANLQVGQRRDPTSVKRRGGGGGKVLLQSVSIRNCERLSIAGNRSLGDLEKTLEESRRTFLGRTGLGFLATGLMALAAAWFFLAPLRRLLKAMEGIGAGKYLAHHPDEERPDEFGTLARAFLAMSKGLQEKDHLSRYVSQSVRRALEDAEFHAAAKEGELREVTILFSGIEGFDEFQEKRSPEEVCQAAENHLRAMDEAVAAFGGDINKVIGDKILVTFDHRTMGSASKAAQTAVEVARSVKDSLSNEGLVRPAIGLNSGPAIAGILGSEEFRVEYTFIGDTVNLASRLCTLAQVAEGTRIVLSGETVKLLPPSPPVVPLPFRKVKGKTKEIEVFLLTN